MEDDAIASLVWWFYSQDLEACSYDIPRMFDTPLSLKGLIIVQECSKKWCVCVLIHSSLRSRRDAETQIHTTENYAMLQSFIEAVLLADHHMVHTDLDKFA